MKVPLKECLLNGKHYSTLQHDSTDTSISEQELVFVLFLNDGQATQKFLSIENSQAAEAPHLVVCGKDTFHRFVIVEFSAHLHGLNGDGASLNLGVHKVLQRY